MVLEDTSERKKRKPRGRPFPKGNINGKPRDSVLDVMGRETDVRGATIAPDQQKPDTGQINKEIRPMQEPTQPISQEKIIAPFSDEQRKENNTVEEDEAELKPVDEMVFSDGKNTLKILLRQKKNRVFRMQVFLNDTQEIRPLTYTGSATAMTFWNLLKGSLK